MEVLVLWYCMRYGRGVLTVPVVSCRAGKTIQVISLLCQLHETRRYAVVAVSILAHVQSGLDCA
eukprot:29821-Eustigmatos_ZCMA.PRE.1